MKKMMDQKKKKNKKRKESICEARDRDGWRRWDDFWADETNAESGARMRPKKTKQPESYFSFPPSVLYSVLSNSQRRKGSKTDAPGGSGVLFLLQSPDSLLVRTTLRYALITQSLDLPLTYVTYLRTFEVQRSKDAMPWFWLFVLCLFFKFSRQIWKIVQNKLNNPVALNPKISWIVELCVFI